MDMNCLDLYRTLVDRGILAKEVFALTSDGLKRIGISEEKIKRFMTEKPERVEEQKRSIEIAG